MLYDIYMILCDMICIHYTDNFILLLILFISNIKLLLSLFTHSTNKDNIIYYKYRKQHYNIINK